MPVPADAVHFFITTVKNLKSRKVSLGSNLKEIAWSGSYNRFAYADNRKRAKELGYDLWASLKKKFGTERDFVGWVEEKGIEERLLYSDSWVFPDFLFKVSKENAELICGSIMELKDSKFGSISSFNSTIPTKRKSLEEIDVINGRTLVSRIAKVLDGELASDENYYTFERECFYLIRTHKNDVGKVKVSMVDGSFFETVPKKHLFYQMFLQVLKDHLKKQEVQIQPESIEKVKEALSYITDQSIIAGSRTIEKASIKPRLRIMAEVHPEGNPHNETHYPTVSSNSFNLIVQKTEHVEEIENQIKEELPEVCIFSIFHKRNGEHIVFQFKPSGKYDTTLRAF